LRLRKLGGLIGGVSGWLSATAGSAALAEPIQVDVRAGTLRAALVELAREGRIDILYGHDLVEGRRVGALKGRFSDQEALARLLEGTGLGHRLTADGVFLVFELPRTLAADPGDGAISEVLVIGRRTQNADIRRTENDIQPYKVAGQRDLAVAPHDSLDQYLRERLPANGQVMAPSQDVSGSSGGANSAIDLRGVGLQRTLVLVDGRRLPGIPTIRGGLEQADVNGVPLEGIERIETLTATAGGIHGPTALGGVVNIVLARDYRGADLTVVGGLASRGDAGRARVEGRIGFTPDHGRTDVMIAGAYATARPFTMGQRDYNLRSLRTQAANNADYFLNYERAFNAITVRTVDGSPLVFDEAYGGAQLGSSYTFLPADFQGGMREKIAILQANSGQLPTTTSPGRTGQGRSLVATPTAKSGLINIRHRLSSRVELFGDGLFLETRARVFSPVRLENRLQTHDYATGNIFANTVYMTFPVDGLLTQYDTGVSTYRVTGGLIATLPNRWRASADLTAGQAVLKDSRRSFRFDSYPLLLAHWNGYVGPEGQAPIRPLYDLATSQAGYRDYAIPTLTSKRLVNNTREGAVRLAGPLVDLPGGPLTLTLMGEVRREHMPKGIEGDQATADRLQTTRSGYVEFRAPLLARDGGFAPTRGLELQLALRRDAIRTGIPENSSDPDGVRIGVHRRADTFTAGFRVLPADWLMLRGSLATGNAPPNLLHLQESAFALKAGPSYNPEVDPKRGGRAIADGQAFAWVRGGWRGVGQEKGRTLSAGVVLNPSGAHGPRISVDFSRLEIKDEISALNLPLQSLIDQEDRYPGRVVRAPLTPEDAALGFTGGRISAVYVGYGNVGRTIAETVDFQLDWTLPDTSQGQWRLYGAATWQPILRTRRTLDGAWLKREGYRDSPLKWRGDAGVQWSAGPLTVDLNAQHLGGYDMRWSPFSVFTVQNALANSTATRVGSQTYFDLVARRMFSRPSSSRLENLEIRLSVQNLLDASPPIVPDPYHMGYDYRGDPRRRRFEVLLTARF
jgi:iron complex outermembrane receptor protein